MSTPTAPAPVPFDLAGPLPTGTTVLEASAGTGKTYTIAGLVTRYVAEGHTRLDQLLVVTFGRAATGELRTRVRERFVTTRAALADPAAARQSPDEVVALLATGADAEVAGRRDRLGTALATFDAATVATTHEFCLQVLHGLGTAADVDPGTVLVESLDDLVVETCDDLYLRFWGLREAGPPPFDRDVALAVGRAAVADADAVLVPAGAEPDSPVGLRVRFATAVRAEVERRARALHVMGFDSLLRRVRDALADPVTGPVARARLRERYRVVLVDEFQDTDPVQWDVLAQAFHGHSTLVVIGDPKQAIYAFRGADVRAYLAARDAATTSATLATSWRSDPRLLDGLQTLLRGAALGDPRIVVRPVAAGHPTAALGPATDDTPVRLRVLARDGLPLTRSGLPQVDPAREAVARDVAGQVVALLADGATVTPRGGTERPLVAADIAVLVRKGTQAQQVREALSDVGVPSVLTGTSSVFATTAAQHWLVLLEALEQPHRSGRVRRFAVTPFVGWTAHDVDREGSAGTDQMALQLREWADVLTTQGVAALLGAVAERHDVVGRLLARLDGERLVTDLRHVAESLHAEQLAAQLGLAGLLSWLRARVEDATGDPDQERSRRLDTDAAAVQVVTVHTSKGLEFPVVLVPYAWDAAGAGRGERLPRGHDGLQRTLHVGGKDAADHGTACVAQDVDEAGEELRLLYVAATRAISRLVLWWVPTLNTRRGPLHRLLLAPDPLDVPVEVDVPDDDEVAQRLHALAAAGAGLAVEPATVSTGRAAAAPSGAAPGGPLEAARFDRQLDVGWRRTSYTGLTRPLHEQQPVRSEPQVGVRDDEPDEEPADPRADPTGDADDRLRAVPSPMADLPGGTGFGTLVHAVLEQADVAAADPLAELLRACREQLAHRASEIDPERLAEALLPAVSTSLGPFAGKARFRDVASGDRLVELGFELPLAGGDAPVRDVRLREVADLLEALLPATDRVAPYAALLRTPALADQQLRGYLTGSLDVVLRVAGPRYLVVDHKTNRLADRDVALTAWHYRASALDAAVLDAHYPLQALLYCVALHRYLRWRQPGYDPQEHLGGVLYLFLRGMCGDAVAGQDDATPPGVWDWQPPAALVVALSDLLAGRPA